MISQTTTQQTANKVKVGVFISGRGTNMQALAKGAKSPEALYEIALVVSNCRDAAGLVWAQTETLNTRCVDHKDFCFANGRFDRHAHEQEISKALKESKIDIICLAGYMRLLSAEFVEQWAGRILNIHPSLLPKYKGIQTHARALAARDSVHGCTVHIVTPELDAGPLLAQRSISVLREDTAESLAARLLPVENDLYPWALESYLKDINLKTVPSCIETVPRMENHHART